MSPRIQILATPTRTSFSQRPVWLLLAITTPEWMVCVSHTTLSPGNRPFARRDEHNDESQTVQSTRARHLQPDLVVSTDNRIVVWLHRHPERRHALLASASVKRHLSCIFPASLGHSLQCLSRALRHGASLLRLRRPPGYGFQKIFSANLRTKPGRKDFPNLP